MSALIATLLFAAPFASADLVMTKENRASIVMTFAPDGAASIVDQNRKGQLIEGHVVIDGEGNLIIHRDEGDVCPDVRVRFLHDLLRGDQSIADVTVITEGAGSAAKNCEITDIEGRYKK